MKDRWSGIDLRQICFLAVFAGMVFFSKPVMAAAPPDGISSRAWASIKEQIRQDQYRFAPACTSDKETSRYRAVNPAHGLEAGFGAHGVTVSPLKKETAHWQVLMNLEGYGSTSKLQRAARVDPDVDEGTLCYRHGPVMEWYKNDQQGLEQGFTIDEPVTNDRTEELVIALNVSGSLVPKAAPGGNEILFCNSRGQVPLRYGSLTAVDADGKNLPVKLSLLSTPDQSRVSTIRISVNLKEARYPIVVDPVFMSGEIKLTPSDAYGGDEFGHSVAMSGDTVVVGAYGNEDAGSFTGSAYIFSRNKDGADQWGQVKKLTASDAERYDRFGWSVAISGDTVVVGAWSNDGGGSAYIFSRNKGEPGEPGELDNWGQVKKLTADDAAAGDWFGWSVAISGDTVVVGARCNDDGGDDSGSAYIFSRNEGESGEPDESDNWGQVKKLTADDADAGDIFGSSVAISGDTVVVGAEWNNDAGDDSGSAYIFSRNKDGSDQWGQVKKLTASDADEGDYFGRSVAMSGDTVVVGANGNDDGGDKSGSAYIFSRNKDGSDNWGQVKKLTASDADAGDRFGISVDISGDTVVVGAAWNGDGGDKSGSAYIFSRNKDGSDQWGQVKKLTASDEAVGDWFGFSVAISGDTVVVGAPQNNDAGYHSGSAYLYPLESSRWERHDKSGTGNFGQSVAVTDDLLAVGAPEDGTNGAVYLFSRNSASKPDVWDQIKKFNGTGSGDNFGWAVDLDRDRLVVGAPNNNSDAGAAYLFARNQGGLNQWNTVKTFTPPVGGDALFGWAVDLDNDWLAVGVPANSALTGTVHLYERNQGGADIWGHVKQLTGPGTDVLVQFGRSLSLDGDTLAVGAPYFNFGRGLVYVFARNHLGPDNWGSLLYVKASDPEADDNFGYALGLDNGRLLVGAPQEDSKGVNAGAVYVFARNQGGADNWGFVDKKLATDGKPGDGFGWSVHVDNDRSLVSANGAGVAYLMERNQPGADQWGCTRKFSGAGLSTAMSGNFLAIGEASAAAVLQNKMWYTVITPTPWLMLLLLGE